LGTVIYSRSALARMRAVGEYMASNLPICETVMTISYLMANTEYKGQNTPCSRAVYPIIASYGLTITLVIYNFLVCVD
jgi:hypothetical protein